MQNQVKSSKPELKYRAFYFSLNLIKYLEKAGTARLAVKIISDQLIRSATSIGANIVEAQGSSSKREFLNYFQISLKSAQETKYWLALFRELVGEKEKEKVIEFITETDELVKILSSSVLTMKGKRRL